MPDGWTIWGPLLLAATERTLAVLGCTHVLLHKRDVRAAACWCGLILLTPLLGITLYVLLGINRLRRRGGKLQWHLETALKRIRDRVVGSLPDREPEPDDPARSRPQLVRVVSALTDWALLPGNTVQPLVGGDDAYPAMLDAIDHARRTVGLCSYIFDDDRVGARFIDALARAHHRGVTVRVLVDDMGSWFLFRSAVNHMRRRGVVCERFLPAFARRTIHLGNLRNHRKILVVDGQTGFTGGMNIQDACMADCPPDRRVIDMHFRLTGPVVTHITETFAADWLFATGELLTSAAWFPAQAGRGDVWARGIADGPDEDYDKMLLTILGALDDARHRVEIVTPYFLPEESTLHALRLAVLRGVRVRLLVPRRSDHFLVQWAGAGHHAAILETGCEVHLTPPPFDHTKLMLVDDDWSLIGSTNWDPRSLRLNFEFNIECHDTSLNATLSEYVEQRVRAAAHLSLDEVRGRPLLIRLRNNTARLATPYL